MSEDPDDPFIGGCAPKYRAARTYEEGYLDGVFAANQAHERESPARSPFDDKGLKPYQRQDGTPFEPVVSILKEMVDAYDRAAHKVAEMAMYEFMHGAGSWEKRTRTNLVITEADMQAAWEKAFGLPPYPEKP